MLAIGPVGVRACCSYSSSPFAKHQEAVNETGTNGDRIRLTDKRDWNLLILPAPHWCKDSSRYHVCVVVHFQDR